MPTANRPQVARDIALVGFSWVAGAAVFFRAQWTSGFNRIMGDPGDSRLVVYLHEHWYLALRGKQAWLDPAFYYPTKGVLGYSDTFFLNQVFYGPLRELGFEPFLAFQLTLVGMSLVGFASFVVLARMAFRAPIVIALAGALVFTFANNLFIQSGHSQLLGVYLVPPLCIIGLKAWRDIGVRPARSAAFGAVLGALCGLELFTSYYVAWMSMLAGGLIALIVLASRPVLVTTSLSRALRRGWSCLAAVLVGFAIGIVPFVLTYIPVLRLTGSRTYKEVMLYAPRWFDVTNVTRQNALWGRVLGHQHQWQLRVETNMALTPLLFVVTVVGAMLVARWSQDENPRRARSVASAVLAAAAVLLLVLPVRIGAGGSLWAGVWHLPGAKAIRAADRLQIVNGLVLALGLVGVVTLGFERWRSKGGSRWWLVGAAAIMLLIIGEQFNTAHGSFLRRDQEAAMLGSVPPIPPGCATFFVTDAVQRSRPPYAYQIDAMLISQRISTPTINGYSGYRPLGWSLDSPQDSQYKGSVKRWVEERGLRPGLCDLELSTMTWVRAPVL